MDKTARVLSSCSARLSTTFRNLGQSRANRPTEGYMKPRVWWLLNIFLYLIKLICWQTLKLYILEVKVCQAPKTTCLKIFFLKFDSKQLFLFHDMDIIWWFSFLAAEAMKFYFPFIPCSLEMPKRRLPALANKGIFLKNFQVNQTKINGSSITNQYSVTMTSYNCSYNIPMMAVSFAQVSLECCNLLFSIYGKLALI